MSTKSDNVAYFADGHTEVITEFDISKDYKDVWFTLESGQSYVYREEREYTESGAWYRTYKFYKHQFVRYGNKFEMEYLVTNDIERIKICVV